MKLYHATKSNRYGSALDNAESIVEEGFEADFDHNHQAAVVSLASRPLPGWGGWQDAWVEVEIKDDAAAAYRYDFDDDLYKCECYAMPERVVNALPRRAVVESDLTK